MPGQLSTHLTDVLTAATAVQTFGTLVTYTPDLDLKVIFDDPDARKSLQEVLAGEKGSDEGQQAMRDAMNTITQLGVHLTSAKTAVGSWKTDVLPLAFQIASDVRGYNTEVQNVVTSINTKLGNLTGLAADQLKTVVTEVKRAIDALQGTLNSRVTTVQRLETALGSFSTNLAELSDDFDTDWRDVGKLLSAEGGVIDAIQSKIGDLNGTITRDIGLIAGGSVVMAVGIGLIIGGVVSTIASGGGATVLGVALIVGGIVVLAGGIAMTTVGGVSLPDARADLEHLTRDLSVIEQVMAFFGTAQTHIHSIDTSAAAGATSVTSLKSYYETLQADLTTMGEPLAEAEQLLGDASSDPATTVAAVTSALNGVKTDLGNLASDWADATADADLLDNALEGITKNVTNTLPSV